MDAAGDLHVAHDDADIEDVAKKEGSTSTHQGNSEDEDDEDIEEGEDHGGEEGAVLAVGTQGEDSGSPDFCQNGIKKKYWGNGQGLKKIACCASSCGRCGGSGCDNRDGGAAACCTSRIDSALKFCHSPDDEACIIPRCSSCGEWDSNGNKISGGGCCTCTFTNDPVTSSMNKIGCTPTTPTSKWMDETQCTGQTETWCGGFWTASVADS